MFYNPDPDKPAFAALAPASRIPPDPVAWFWPGRIPHAQLTLLVGDPGVGKSLLAADLAARVSGDQPWPDQPDIQNPSFNPAPNDSSVPSVTSAPSASHNYPWQSNPFFAAVPCSNEPLHHGAAIIASPEDHPAQILLPRLQAAGARLERVAVLYGVTEDVGGDGLVSPLLLPDNLPALRGAACRTVEPRLLVLDPLHALLSPAAQNNPAVLAGLLASLADYARSFNIAVLASIHLAKSGHARSLYNVRGSIALIAAARSVHLLSHDPDHADRRILTPLKTVYGLPPPPLAFRILPGPRIEWEAAPALPPPELIDRATTTGSALSEACDWLTDYLRPGPRSARKLLKSASRVGISHRTLFRAKRLLAVRSFKFKTGSWVWSQIPADPVERSSTSHSAPAERSSTSLASVPAPSTPFPPSHVPTFSLSPADPHPAPRPQKTEDCQSEGPKS